MFYSKLRVDLTSSVTVSALEGFLTAFSTSYAYVVESFDTHPHMHCYLSHSRTRQHLRSLIRGMGASGNKSYSLSSLDSEFPIEYLAYMYKEGIVYTCNIPQNILDEAQAYMEKVKSEIKSKKDTKKDIISKILALCEPEWLESPTGYFEQIQTAIIKYHIDNKLLIRKFVLHCYWDTIVVRYSPITTGTHHIFDGYKH